MTQNIRHIVQQHLNEAEELVWVSTQDIENSVQDKKGMEHKVVVLSMSFDSIPDSREGKKMGFKLGFLTISSIFIIPAGIMVHITGSYSAMNFLVSGLFYMIFSVVWNRRNAHKGPPHMIYAITNQRILVFYGYTLVKSYTGDDIKIVEVEISPLYTIYRVEEVASHILNFQKFDTITVSDAEQVVEHIEVL